MDISIDNIRSHKDAEQFLADIEEDGICFEDVKDTKCIKKLKQKQKQKSSQYELELLSKRGKVLETKILENPQAWIWENRKLINKQLKAFDESVYSDDFDFEGF